MRMSCTITGRCIYCMSPSHRYAPILVIIFFKWYYLEDLINKLIIMFYIIAPAVSDPCVPNPCGPNSICRADGTVAHCSCRPPMFEDPPSCRPECRSDSECPPDRACRNNKCRDPCPGTCGAYAVCQTKRHVPICTCPENYHGDPFIRCQVPGKLLNIFYNEKFYVGTLKILIMTLIFSTVIYSEAKQKVPCSDCGPNTDCIDGQCRCQPSFFGAPPFCRYECLSSSDCDWTLTCTNRRCVDPCPGACGQGATCTPVAHEPRCDCPPGTRGNPLVACPPVENIIRKTDTHGFFSLLQKFKRS